MRYKILQKIKDLSPDYLVSEYLICCCMYHELLAADMDRQEFDYLAKRLLEFYDKATHPHKGIIDKEKLKKCSSGAYIKFYPSITRTCACHRAAKLEGGPMYNRGTLFINSYVAKMTGLSVAK